MTTTRSDLLDPPEVRENPEVREDHHPCLTRRSVMTGGVVGLGAACLAACSSGGSGEEPTSAGAEPTTEQSSAPGGEETDAGGGESSGAGGDAVAQLDEVPVGGAISVEIAGQPALLTQPEAGTVKAFSAICTHQGCTVAPGDGDLACPCHNSMFDLTDGSVIEGPAQEPLPEIAVSVVDGAVVAT